MYCFDIGIGNGLIDYTMQKYYNIPFDEDGKISLEGLFLYETTCLYKGTNLRD